MKTILLSLSLLLLANHIVFAQSSYPTLDKTPSNAYTSLIQHAHFTKALANIEKETKLANRNRKRKNQQNPELDSLTEVCERGLNYLKGTDQVIILDSTVVNKEIFLSAFPLSSDLGSIRQSPDGETTEYETEISNHLFTSERPSPSSPLQLYSHYRENGKSLQKQLLEGLEVDGDLNYPFLMTDGITFYFSARSKEGLGNYDIYVTRYDADENKFYKAENMGFPYNSYANDYLMIIDEQNNLGWFASDRYQPSDKVCIYTFIPNTSRHPFDYESTDESKIIAAANLKSIKSLRTKSNEQQRIEARQRLALIKLDNVNSKLPEFTIVINDNYTYHNFSDFQSPEARNQCLTWLQKTQELNAASSELESLRNKYSTNKSASLKTQILQLEQKIETLILETKEAEKLTRKLELNN